MRRGVTDNVLSLAQTRLLGYGDLSSPEDRRAYYDAAHYIKEVRAARKKDKVGMNPVFVGQLQEATDLGINPSEVGCNVGCGCPEVGFSLNPIKAVSKAASGIFRTAKKMPVLKQGIRVADKILHSKLAGTIQKIASNPVVSTFAGPVALPVAFGMAAAKGGAKGALAHARAELKNPVRGVVIKAVAIAFPPVAPAAVALETANRVLDAVESKNAAEAAKAVAQIAATYALGELGDSSALKGLEYLKKAKEIRANIPKGILTPAGNPRPLVCGAKSEEARGLWLKTHIFKDGPFMCATVYSVANGDAEVFNIRVDTRPIAAAIARYHDRLHGKGAVVSGTMFENLQKLTAKLGRGKLANEAFAVSKNLAVKAKCKSQSPSRPVSDVALAAFASARKGVDAVDRNKKMTAALTATSDDLKKYMSLKSVLMKLTPAQRAEKMRDPSIKNVVLKGIGSKYTLASFVKSGGPQKAAVLKKNATNASKQFSTLARAAKSSDPRVRSDAQTMSKIVNITATARQKTKNASANLKGGIPGLVIDSRGRIRKGTFKRSTPGKGQLAQVILAKAGIQTGLFTKVSGTSPFDVGGDRPIESVEGCPEDLAVARLRLLNAKYGTRARMARGGLPFVSGPHTDITPELLEFSYPGVKDGFTDGISGTNKARSRAARLIRLKSRIQQIRALAKVSGLAPDIFGAVKKPVRRPVRKPPPRKPPPKKKPIKRPVLKAVAKLPPAKRAAIAKKALAKMPVAKRAAVVKRTLQARAATPVPNYPGYESVPVPMTPQEDTQESYYESESSYGDYATPPESEYSDEESMDEINPDENDSIDEDTYVEDNYEPEEYASDAY